MKSNHFDVMCLFKLWLPWTSDKRRHMAPNGNHIPRMTKGGFSSISLENHPSNMACTCHMTKMQMLWFTNMTTICQTN